MKLGLAAIVAAVAIGSGAYYFTRADEAQPGAGAGIQRTAGRNAGGGFGGGGGGPRLPLTVEVGPVSRADMAEELTVVGTLIAQATVEAVPKVSGRLESVAVRLGDRVVRGQRLAKVEDREILEQVKQAQASYDVGAATVRQREADLRLAQTNLERNRSLFERQLIARQIFDDTDARHQAAQAQVDLARAQFSQSQARLDELKINLANTVITSPVSGFVGSRSLDAGAWVTPNSTFLSVVDISTVRLVANIVEKDLRRVAPGLETSVAVDAFPGEQFMGRIARVAPVLDPTTRTAQIEIEITNPRARLKPGMYANVEFTVDRRPQALVVPANAVVDLKGQRGVFKADGDVARFHPIQVGMSQNALIEVAGGLAEGDRIITTGASALREGDKIALVPADRADGGRAGRSGQDSTGGQGGGRGAARASGGQR